MVIEKPVIIDSGDEIHVSAGLGFEKAFPGTLESLWFSFPAEYKHFVSDRADAFVIALLLRAMKLGEDIEVRGVVSPRLLYSLQEYQRIFHFWFPRKLKIINIYCENVQPPMAFKQRNVACAFSGGVDSFYTLWSHVPQNEAYADCRLTHAIFVQGFDIPLTDELTFTITRKEYARLMRKLGLSLLVAKTNVRHYAEPIGWEFSHGAALIAVALVLQGGLSRFYTPGPRTYRYTDLRPVGLHPVLDHLLSTEALDVIHDGASVDRFNKTAIIAKWPETYDRLRVCWVKPDGLRNCCRCNKCLWTMATLQLLGVLDRYTTFPLPLDRSALRRCFFKKEIQRIYARQILQRAKELRRVDLAFDLRCALARTWWRRKLPSFKRNL